MPNLIRWTQIVLKGSEIVLFFKLFMKMKINQKFAKKAIVITSLTAGIIGFNGIFNDAQASGSGGSYCYQTCTKKGGGSGGECVSGTGNCASSSSCG